MEERTVIGRGRLQRIVSTGRPLTREGGKEEEHERNSHPLWVALLPSLKTFFLLLIPFKWSSFPCQRPSIHPSSFRWCPFPHRPRAPLFRSFPFHQRSFLSSPRLPYLFTGNKFEFKWNGMNWNSASCPFSCGSSPFRRCLSSSPRVILLSPLVALLLWVVLFVFLRGRRRRRGHQWVEDFPPFLGVSFFRRCLSSFPSFLNVSLVDWWASNFCGWYPFPRWRPSFPGLFLGLLSCGAPLFAVPVPSGSVP